MHIKHVHYSFVSDHGRREQPSLRTGANPGPSLGWKSERRKGEAQRRLPEKQEGTAGPWVRKASDNTLIQRLLVFV